MKISVSIPDDLYNSAEILARRLCMSRSKLYTTAVAEYIAQHGAGDVTERLDEIYAKEKSDLDPKVLAVQIGLASEESW